MTAERFVLLVFLGINAVEDIRKKEILLVPTLLYGFPVLWHTLISAGEWNMLLTGCIPGLILLAFSLLSKGQVGLGDVWIVLVMGLQLGFTATLGILWGAIFLLSVWGFLFQSVKGKTDCEKLVLPMVPFLFLAMLLGEVFR
ncbi:MAG: prepilin peptidase [Lachnospiraceae bacterium]|nr:prepilin peptidase [Lachnospiraceae bacterium]